MKLHGLSLLGHAGGLVGVLDEHDAIFAAIRDRREEDARNAMLRHIKGSYDRLFEGRMLDLSL
jgi:GntR family transcriptional repressor for pyruvate dehydrogenase complex